MKCKRLLLFLCLCACLLLAGCGKPDIEYIRMDCFTIQDEGGMHYSQREMPDDPPVPFFEDEVIFLTYRRSPINRSEWGEDPASFEELNIPEECRAVIQEALSAPFPEEASFHDPVPSDSGYVWLRAIMYYPPDDNAPNGSYVLSVLFASPENEDTLIIFKNTVDKTDDFSYADCTEISFWEYGEIDGLGSWLEQEVWLFTKYWAL